MSHRKFNALFLDPYNDARSILAESAANHLAVSQGKLSGFSAGREARGIDAGTLEFLRRNKLPTENLRSTSWDEFLQAGAPEFDFIFVLCQPTLRELDQLMGRHPVPVDRKTEAIVIDANREFHMTIIRACGNERINALMKKILDDIDRAYYYGLMRHPKFMRIQQDHDLIVKAMEARDAAEAERLARAHIDQGYSIVMDSVLMGVSLAGHAPKL